MFEERRTYCAFRFGNSCLLKVSHILPWSLGLHRCSVIIFVRGFDFSYQVLKLIPNEWSIGLISQFLSGSVRLSLHKSRTTKILSGLARGENLKVSMILEKNIKLKASAQNTKREIKYSDVRCHVLLSWPGKFGTSYVSLFLFFFYLFIFIPAQF